jgi:hypothetical protein
VKLVSSSPNVPDLRDLRDGSTVDQVLLVREREIRQTRTGADYMRLALADRTGVVVAVVWDDVDEAAATATAGEPVRVIGTFSQHPRYGPQLTVQSVVAPLEVDWERLLDSPATPLAELASSQPVREAARAFDGRAGTWPALRRQRRLTRADAAKRLASELGFPVDSRAHTTGFVSTSTTWSTAWPTPAASPSAF